MGLTDVVSVSDARAGLTRTLRRFRAHPDTDPLVFGSHRKPEAVILPAAAYERMRQANALEAPPIREALHERKRLIERLARANRIESVRVFGSVARGDDTAESDVDLLVYPTPDATLFDFAQFGIDVEDLLGRPVDVVSSRSLDPVRDATILREATAL